MIASNTVSLFLGRSSVVWYVCLVALSTVRLLFSLYVDYRGQMSPELCIEVASSSPYSLFVVLHSLTDHLITSTPASQLAPLHLMSELDPNAPALAMCYTPKQQGAQCWTKYQVPRYSTLRTLYSVLCILRNTCPDNSRRRRESGENDQPSPTLRK